jgi:P27 family predicted phage terminase small subunit
MNQTRKTPRHLGKHGGKLWRELRDEYQLDDGAGIALLTTACECLDRMRAAQEAIQEHGEVVTDRYGQVKVNPACGLEKDARNGLLAALKALNLDIEPLRDRVGRPGGYATGRWNGEDHE